jgi:signal transduction histidine kinase
MGVFPDGRAAAVGENWALRVEGTSREGVAPRGELHREGAGLLDRLRALRRPLILGGAAILFVLIFILAQRSGDADETVGLLYVVPVGAVGLELGLGAGLGAALLALALSAVWLATSQPGPEAAGSAISAVALVVVGGLAGGIRDRTRVQTALHSELELSRRHVSAQLRSADRVLGHHEAERREIAGRLHDQVAQTMAAALMALSLVEDEAGDAVLHRSQIESIRPHMHTCLEDLRDLATSLRPAVLDVLGLGSALERVCAEEGHRAGQPIDLRLDGRLENLSDGVEISAYRTVREVLGALSRATEVDVSADEEGGRLRIAIAAAESGRSAVEVERELATTRARLELLGGSLQIDSRPHHDGSSTLAVLAGISLRPGEAIWAA